MAVTNYYTVNGVIEGEKTAGGTRVDYLTDALGSVTATVSDSAQVVNTYRYKPYGKLLAKTGNGADPAFTWVGSQGYRPTQRKFSDFYVRARHPDTSTGRWTTKDLLGFITAALNVYQYAHGLPTTGIDPSGLLCFRQGVGDCSNYKAKDGATGPCAWARDHPGDFPQLSGEVTSCVVCCNGKGTPCTRALPRDLPKQITDCIQAHEKCHVPDTDCSDTTSPKNMPAHCGAPASGSDVDIAKGECKCMPVELDCLMSWLEKLKDKSGKDYKAGICVMLSACQTMDKKYHCAMTGHLLNQCTWVNGEFRRLFGSDVKYCNDLIVRMQG